jgi:nitrite reductase (NADH) large subunit
VRIDRIRRVVVTRSGAEHPYDRLLVATGSSPVVLPLPGNELPGVLTYRDIADTEAMIDAAKRYSRASSSAAGLLGLEAANGLRTRGMDVTVVHLMPWLMERQLDRTAAGLLQRSLEAKGSRSGSRRRPRRWSPASQGAWRRAARVGRDAVGRAGRDGRSASAPRRRSRSPPGCIATAASSSTTRCRPYDPRVYAVGECVAHRGAATARRAALRDGEGVREPPRRLRHRALRRLGDLDQAQGHRHRPLLGGQLRGRRVDRRDRARRPVGGLYKKLVLDGDRVVGSVLVGDTSDGAWYFKLIREKRNVADLRDRLMFGEQNLGDTGHQGQSRALAMADDAEVCGCNGVCKGKIVRRSARRSSARSTRCASTPRRRRRAARAPGWSSKLLVATAGADYSAAPKVKADLRLHRTRRTRRCATRSARRSSCRSRRRCASSIGARPTAARPAGPRSTTT